MNTTLAQAGSSEHRQARTPTAPSTTSSGNPVVIGNSPTPPRSPSVGALRWFRCRARRLLGGLRQARNVAYAVASRKHPVAVYLRRFPLRRFSSSSANPTTNPNATTIARPAASCQITRTIRLWRTLQPYRRSNWRRPPLRKRRPRRTQRATNRLRQDSQRHRRRNRPRRYL